MAEGSGIFSPESCWARSLGLRALELSGSGLIGWDLLLIRDCFLGSLLRA